MSKEGYISAQKLENFCIEALLKCGLSEEDARTAATVLVTTDTWGTFTHGTKSLRGYVQRLRGGGLNPRAQPEIVRSGPAWATVDGHSALGMITSCFAMRLAMEKAAITGIGMVTVRSSCHFGAAGYYASLALERDMIGQAMCNDMPSVNAPGSRNAVMGSNPFAYAAPAGRGKPLLLDMATSAVAGGKVLAAHAQGRPIPDNWIVDEAGHPTTDAGLFSHAASLLPMGGHKGYGIALMIETFSGLLSGAGVTHQILGWSRHDPSLATHHGHAFLAVDVGAMVPLEEYKQRMDELIAEIKAAPRADGVERIYLPGEMEWEKREVALAKGIVLPPDVIASLNGLADDLGMNAAELWQRDNA